MKNFSHKTKGRVFIIAEAGVNHNGSLRLALKLVDGAERAGADAVKFQTFVSSELVSSGTPKADYQKKRTVTQQSHRDMIRALELDRRAHEALLKRCQTRKILFLSSPFDLPSIRLLRSLGLAVFKIPSGEITNLPYLRAIGRLRKKVILSTGMSDLGEIRAALKVLESGGTRKENIVLLQCNTEYPTPFEHANLSAMRTLRRAFGVRVGYSDHTRGTEASIAAVALGAEVIEKHFTLDRNSSGPDHAASLTVSELGVMIRAIRNVEMCLGSGIKKASPSEQKNILIARKSIIASRDIARGEFFTEKNITAKRPGTGLSPMLWDRVVGRIAKKSFRSDECIAL